MRRNLPVTQIERTFPAEQKLISSTDLKGIIRHCNDAFEAVSGYSRAELIGQPHNIVRHPDMPPAAYKNMWEHLKAGRPWMGIVKNRCKNGDYSSRNRQIAYSKFLHRFHNSENCYQHDKLNPSCPKSCLLNIHLQ